MGQVLLWLAMALAQNPSAPLTFGALRDGVRVTSAPTSQELTIRWAVYSAPTTLLASPDVAVPLNQLELVTARDVASPIPPERNPELSSDRLVVAAVDAAGLVLSWRIIADPRIVRSEGPGPDGVLTGVTLYRREVEFNVAVPAHPTMTGVRIYEPRWTGSEWLLEPMATVPVSAR